MSSADLLFEIGLEELPPHSQTRLGQALLANVKELLQTAQISYGHCQWFAAPRRLGLLIKNVAIKSTEQSIERRGPRLEQAFDREGNPTKAALGFAASCGVTFEQLSTTNTDKGEWLFYQATRAGCSTVEQLPSLIEQSLNQLPIAKLMRWGSGDLEFVRPVHWIVLLFGTEVVEMNLYGVASDRLTHGHRFMAPEKMRIDCPLNYENKLHQQGYVIADFSRRRSHIYQEIHRLAEQYNATIMADDDLFDEVTGLVEWPEVLVAEFSSTFLAVPAEALITSMKQHQKVFPMYDSMQQLLPQFIFVSNIKSTNPEQVIIGNQKVMHARLSDAAFFYNTDQQTPLINRLAELKTVLFHKKLGSQYDRVMRVKVLALTIASSLNADQQNVAQVAELAKCDLMTAMVFEFPELQGIMGKYYALNDNINPIIANAIADHYLPKFAGDSVPLESTAICMALADKLDLLVSIFSVGSKPTGTKDPYGLRRATIGILRILIENQLPLDLHQLLQQANLPYQTDVQLIYQYMVERWRTMMVEQHIKHEVFTAVSNVMSSNLSQAVDRMQALQVFSHSDNADQLLQLYKRVNNVLQKAPKQTVTIDKQLLQTSAEQQLATTIATVESEANLLLTENNYAGLLGCLMSLSQPLSIFFEQVMVMVEDRSLRENRLALLSKVQHICWQFADLSQL